MATSKPKTPVVAWKHGPMRIIVSSEPCEHGVDSPSLSIEMMFRDALGEPAWRPVSFGHIQKVEPDLADGIFALAIEAIYQIEVIPGWVRDFVKREREEFGQRQSIDDVEYEDEHTP